MDEVVPEPVPVSDEILKKWKAKANQVKAQLKQGLKQGIPKLADEEPIDKIEVIEESLKDQNYAYNQIMEQEFDCNSQRSIAVDVISLQVLIL